jgi:multiple sugar transport system substrate-binding protein
MDNSRKTVTKSKQQLIHLYPLKGWLLMKKRVLIINLVCISALLLAACGSVSTPTTAPPAQLTNPPATQPTTGEEPNQEKVTIRFSCWSDTIGTPEVVQSEMLDPFEAKTGIHVELEILPWEQFWTKIQTLATTNDIPDVFCMSAAYGWDYANLQQIIDLQPLIDRDLKIDDYFKEMGATIRWPNKDGDFYSFPFRWVTNGLFYNKDLFDASGVPYPTKDWTYADLVTAAQKLTKDTNGDGQIDQWGFYANILMNTDQLVHAWGGTVLNADKTKCTLTDPKAIAGIQWMMDTVNKWKISPAPGLVGSEEGQFKAGVFPSGKVAMVMDGSYNTANWQTLPFNWDVTYVPAGPVTRSTFANPDSLSISVMTQYEDAAWEFIKYFTSPDIQNNIKVVGLGGIPFLKSVAYSESFLQNPGLPSGFKDLVDSFPYGDAFEFPSKWVEWHNDIMNNSLQAAMLGDMSVTDAVNEACSGIDDVLATIKRP